MKKNGAFLVTLSTAVLTAAIIIGGYAIYHHRKSRTQAQELHPIGIRKVETAKKSTADNSGNPTERTNFKAPPPIPSDLPDKEELREQFRILKAILELPPERLAKIRTSIEKIEAMPTDQKARMLSMIRDKNGSESAAARKARAEELLAAMPENIRALIDYRTKSFSPERRTAFIEGYAAACEDTLKTSLNKSSSSSK